mgnify:CR=1 FL=1
MKKLFALTSQVSFLKKNIFFLLIFHVVKCHYFIYHHILKNKFVVNFFRIFFKKLISDNIYEVIYICWNSIK